jgi:hypothetical protein
MSFATALSDAENVRDAGFGQLSGLRSLQRLNLTESFESCTNHGLVAALAIMTGTCLHLVRLLEVGANQRCAQFLLAKCVWAHCIKAACALICTPTSAVLLPLVQAWHR